jgi:hypothetical protein
MKKFMMIHDRKDAIMSWSKTTAYSRLKWLLKPIIFHTHRVVCDSGIANEQLRNGKRAVLEYLRELIKMGGDGRKVLSFDHCPM